MFNVFYIMALHLVSKTHKYFREMYCSSSFVHWWISFGFDGNETEKTDDEFKKMQRQVTGHTVEYRRQEHR